MTRPVPINGDDLWVKVVAMLQQNWASIEPEEDRVRLHFISDTGEVFDSIALDTAADAEAALTRNGFRRFRDAPDLQRFVRPPAPPFIEGSHPNGPI